MPIKPEAALCKKLGENLPRAQITRIENRLNLGIPDLLIALDSPSIFLMMELKVVKTGLKINLSPHQYSFHLKHASIGCPTFILVHYYPPESSGDKPMLKLYRGAQALFLFNDGVKVPPLAQWPVRAVNWAEMRELLAAG